MKIRARRPDLRTRKSGQFGFTLIETMITLGIASGLVLAVMEAVKLTTQQAKSTQASSDWTAIVSQVNFLVSDPNQCGCFLVKNVMQYTPGNLPAGQVVTNGSPAALNIYTVAAGAYQSNGVAQPANCTVAGFVLAQAPTGGNIWAANPSGILVAGYSQASPNASQYIPYGPSTANTNGITKVYLDTLEIDLTAWKVAGGIMGASAMPGGPQNLYATNLIPGIGRNGIVFQAYRSDAGNGLYFQCLSGVNLLAQQTCFELGGAWSPNTGTQPPPCQLEQIALARNNVATSANAVPGGANGYGGQKVALWRYNNANLSSSFQNPSQYDGAIGVDSATANAIWFNAMNNTLSSGFVFTANGGGGDTSANPQSQTNPTSPTGALVQIYPTSNTTKGTANGGSVWYTNMTWFSQQEYHSSAGETHVGVVEIHSTNTTSGNKDAESHVNGTDYHINETEVHTTTDIESHTGGTEDHIASTELHTAGGTDTHTVESETHMDSTELHTSQDEESHVSGNEIHYNENELHSAAAEQHSGGYDDHAGALEIENHMADLEIHTSSTETHSTGTDNHISEVETHQSSNEAHIGGTDYHTTNTEYHTGSTDTWNADNETHTASTSIWNVETESHTNGTSVWMVDNESHSAGNTTWNAENEWHENFSETHTSSWEQHFNYYVFWYSENEYHYGGTEYHVTSEYHSFGTETHSDEAEGHSGNTDEWYSETEYHSLGSEYHDSNTEVHYGPEAHYSTETHYGTEVHYGYEQHFSNDDYHDSSWELHEFGSSIFDEVVSINSNDAGGTVMNNDWWGSGTCATGWWSSWGCNISGWCGDGIPVACGCNCNNSGGNIALTANVYPVGSGNAYVHGTSYSGCFCTCASASGQSFYGSTTVYEHCAQY